MLDKFFLSKTLKNRFENSEINKINKGMSENLKNKVSIVSLNNKLVLAQNQQDPIFYAIQKAIPAACLITVYYEEPNQNAVTWTGSGFLIQPGLIVTSNHVLPGEQGQSIIKISFDGDDRVLAQVQSRNPSLDIGFLTIGNMNIPPVAIAEVEPQIGEQIAVIGAPEGWENVITVGYVSAIHQTPNKLPEPAWNDLIFIDADIYEGSSGSMVINNQGEVIGVVMGIIGKEAVDKSIGQNAVIPIKKVLNIS